MSSLFSSFSHTKSVLSTLQIETLKFREMKGLVQGHYLIKASSSSEIQASDPVLCPPSPQLPLCSPQCEAGRGKPAGKGLVSEVTVFNVRKY